MPVENKKEYIYHRLAQGLEEMEQEFGGKYGTKVTLYFKDGNTSYQEMFRFICKQARTTPSELKTCLKLQFFQIGGTDFQWNFQTGWRKG